MLLARLDVNNKVVELLDFPDKSDPMSAFHPSLKWVKAQPGAKVGSVWNGASFDNTVVKEIASETSLPKEVLKDRVRSYRHILFTRMLLKVREWETLVDAQTLTAIWVKMSLIDSGIIQQPVIFNLIGGPVKLTRSDLADLLREISQRSQAIYAAEAALIEAIDKGRVRTQKEIEASFPQSSQSSVLSKRFEGSIYTGMIGDGA